MVKTNILNLFGANVVPGLVFTVSAATSSYFPFSSICRYFIDYSVNRLNLKDLRQFMGCLTPLYLSCFSYRTLPVSIKCHT